jgi:hypothetical protein
MPAVFEDFRAGVDFEWVNHVIAGCRKIFNGGWKMRLGCGVLGAFLWPPTTSPTPPPGAKNLGF